MNNYLPFAHCGGGTDFEATKDVFARFLWCLNDMSVNVQTIANLYCAVTLECHITDYVASLSHIILTQH